MRAECLKKQTDIYTFLKTFTYTKELHSGKHVIAVLTENLSGPSGFIASVKLGGNSVSGGSTPGGWIIVATDPGDGWNETGFDASSWATLN